MRIVTIKKGTSTTIVKDISTDSMTEKKYIYYSPKATRRIKAERTPVISTRLKFSRYPFLKGVGSLGNLLGKIPTFEDYMRGSDFQDMAIDWNCVGNDFNVAIAKVKRKHGQKR